MEEIIFETARWQRRRWHRIEETERRYYEAHLHQNLWGQWVVTRVNGRISTASGRVADILVDSYEDGLALLEAIQKRRRQRRYLLVYSYSD